MFAQHAAQLGRTLLSRGLILVLAAIFVVLVCQVPLLFNYIAQGPGQPPLVEVHPDRYWELAQAFPERLKANTALHDFLRHSWWRSLVALGAGTAFALVVGTLVGFASAAAAGGRLRGPVLTGTLFSLGIPDFLLVFMAQRGIVWMYRNWDFKLLPILSDVSPRGWILPSLAVGLLPAAFLARIAAIALDDIYRQDYIRTARAKGLHPRRVLYGHALKNAIPRIAAALPQALGFAVSALLPVEFLTHWPGLGYHILRGYTASEGFLGEVDRLTTAALALVITFLLIDMVVRLTAAALGGQRDAAEAEAMV